MKKRHTNGGYLGLIALLVGVAIISLFFTRLYLTPKTYDPTSEFEPRTASGTPTRTGIEQMHVDVDAAKVVQEKLNTHNTEINNLLGE